MQYRKVQVLCSVLSSVCLVATLAICGCGAANRGTVTAPPLPVTHYTFARRITPPSIPGETYHGLHVDGSGAFYVGDNLGSTGYKIAANGAILQRYDQPVRDTSFVDVTTDSSGNVLFAGAAGGYVSKFAPDGTHLLNFGMPNFSRISLFYPEAIAIDKQGNVYVGDTTCYVFKYSDTGSLIERFDASLGLIRTGPISGIGVDATNNIVVAIGGSIRKFTNDGSFMSQFAPVVGRMGNQASPRCLTLDSSGNVFTFDPYNFSIDKFSISGTLLCELPTSGWADGIAVDKNDVLYAVDGPGIDVFQPS